MNRILVVCFFCINAALIFAKPLDLEINASNAILINADNNRILYQKNAKEQAYPASITKMITIWYVIENYSNDLNNYFTASANALKTVDADSKIASNYKMPPYLLEPDGVNFDIKINEKLTLNDLLHGMVIISGNDACNVIAENLGGTIDNFMKNLNEFVKSKGILSTNLCNPHGLHHPSHVTTVYDISQMMKFAIRNPKFLEIFTCKSYVRPKTNKQQKKELVTFNKLLKSGKFHYKYAICSKTGYHSKAKFNLLTVAKKDDRTLIAAVFGCSANENRYLDTIKLFETAFSEKKVTKKILDKEKLFLAKVNGGSKVLKAAMIEDLNVEYYPSEEGDIKIQILWDELKAPIKMGQKVGSIQLLTDDNVLIKKQNIYSTTDIKKSLFTGFIDLFKKT